jgi:hypothetical protein
MKSESAQTVEQQKIFEDISSFHADFTVVEKQESYVCRRGE